MTLTPSEASALAIPSGVRRFLADDRDEWLKMRRQDVTASVIAALLGAHPYTTPFELYCRKLGLIPDEQVKPKITENSISYPPMLRGTKLERVAGEMLQDLRPTWQIEPCRYYYTNPTDRIGATPDFIAVDPERPGFGVIQIKTTDYFGFRDKWRQEDRSVEAPLWVTVQSVTEGALSGASWADVGVMVSGMTLDLHLIPGEIHAGIMARLRTEVAAFWRMVAAETPPDPDFGRDGDVIRALYPESNGMELDLSGDNRLPELAAERDTIKASISELSESKEAIDNEFIFRLGPNESAQLAGGRRVTLKTTHRKGGITKPSTFRTLRFSEA